MRFEVFSNQFIKKTRYLEIDFFDFYYHYQDKVGNILFLNFGRKQFQILIKIEVQSLAKICVPSFGKNNIPTLEKKRCHNLGPICFLRSIMLYKQTKFIENKQYNLIAIINCLIAIIKHTKEVHYLTQIFSLTGQLYVRSRWFSAMSIHSIVPGKR